MTDTEQPDRALVKRVLEGKEDAFEEFFHGYFPRLYRFALPRVGHHEDAAEDIVQATLCHAITVMKTYRGEAALFTWLCTLCRREIFAYTKRQARMPSTSEPLDESSEVRGALESLATVLEDSPEHILRRKEIACAVQAILDFLPAGYGNALEWKYALELPVNEIARRMNLSPKAAESLLTRARQAFRREFAALSSGHLRPGPSKP